MNYLRPILSGLIGAVAVYFLLRLARPSARVEDGRRVIEYGRGYRVLVVFLAPFSLFVAYAATQARPGQTVIAALVALFFIIASVYLTHEVFFVKFGYDADFIYHYTPLRGQRKVAWQSITDAGYSAIRQAHYLATEHQGKIWFSPWMDGFAEFVDYANRQWKAKPENPGD